ncbi:MAG TPA: LamG domain-containing protein, partial [Phycisphaerales bacterium]|nr:LamG domain-containing protein [Phycisphaerales bacterium]
MASPAQIVGFAGFPVPEGLVPGTSYYWRVDEVNDANAASPWKGDVWSFTVPSRKAYNAVPADGARFQAADLTLSWTSGFDAKLHHLYFGDDAAEVDAGGATYKGPLAETTYTPGTLESGKAYFWRVDEFDGFETHKGDVLSFQIKPDIPITDPDLICWWQLDEGQGTTVLDWSGHGYDAVFTGAPQWVEGYDDTALNFNGISDSVIARLEAEETWQAYTVTVWAKANVLWQSVNSCVFANHITYATDTPSMQISFDDNNNYQYHGSVDEIIGPATTGWAHLAVACDGPTTTVYYNGNLVSSVATGAGDPVFTKFAIGINRAEDNWFDGAVDDLRVYNKVLTQEEIQLVLRIDPLRAWNGSPADGSTPDIDAATPLSWSRGDSASSHEVYLGLDKD